MTNEEKRLLIDYLKAVGEIDEEDVEDQFQEWYKQRDGVVSGERHYKDILAAANLRASESDSSESLVRAARAFAADPTVPHWQAVMDCMSAKPDLWAEPEEDPLVELAKTYVQWGNWGPQLTRDTLMEHLEIRRPLSPGGER